MKKLILSALALLTIFASCNDESLVLDDTESTMPLLHQRSTTDIGESEEFPYEVRKSSDDLYSEIEESLTNLFAEESEGGFQTPLDGIFILETGSNYFQLDPENLYMDTYIAEYEDTFITERSVTLNLEEGYISNIDLREQLIETYQSINSQIDSSIKHQITDVRSVRVENGQIFFTISSKFVVSPTLSVASGPWLAPPVVASATVSKFAGLPTNCNAIATTASWKDLEVRVKNSLPSQVAFGLYSSIATYSTYSFNQLPLIDGSYLPGQSNPLFPQHADPMVVYECLSTVHQDAYAQAVADQLHKKLGKQYVWHGIASLFVTKDADSDPNPEWGFRVTFGSYKTPKLPNLGPSLMGL